MKLLLTISLLALATTGWAGEPLEPNVICTTGMDVATRKCQREAARKQIEWALGQDDRSVVLPTQPTFYLDQPGELMECDKRGTCVPVKERQACLVQMEAAMRAIEPFADKPTERFGPATDDLMFDYDTRQDKLRKEIARLNQRDAAWAQWDSVKRECWGKP